MAMAGPMRREGSTLCNCAGLIGRRPGSSSQSVLRGTDDVDIEPTKCALWLAGVGRRADGHGDRTASRQIVEWSDLGPHAVFADAPERKVTIKLERELTRDGLDGPLAGDAETLSLRTSPNASDAGGVAVTASAVVMRVTYELLGQAGALQKIELIAISESGDVDPVTIG